jgi:hypothetical protein
VPGAGAIGLDGAGIAEISPFGDGGGLGIPWLLAIPSKGKGFIGCNLLFFNIYY